MIFISISNISICSKNTFAQSLVVCVIWCCQNERRQPVERICFPPVFLSLQHTRTQYCTVTVQLLSSVSAALCIIHDSVTSDQICIILPVACKCEGCICVCAHTLIESACEKVRGEKDRARISVLACINVFFPFCFFLLQFCSDMQFSVISLQSVCIRQCMSSFFCSCLFSALSHAVVNVHQNPPLIRKTWQTPTNTFLSQMSGRLYLIRNVH